MYFWCFLAVFWCLFMFLWSGWFEGLFFCFFFWRKIFGGFVGSSFLSFWEGVWRFFGGSGLQFKKKKKNMFEGLCSCWESLWKVLGGVFVYVFVIVWRCVFFWKRIYEYIWSVWVFFREHVIDLGGLCGFGCLFLQCFVGFLEGLWMFWGCVLNGFPVFFLEVFWNRRPGSSTPPAAAGVSAFRFDVSGPRTTIRSGGMPSRMAKFVWNCSALNSSILILWREKKETKGFPNALEMRITTSSC